MISNGCDLFHLSNILGHSNLMTTAIYLHVKSDAERAALEKGCAEILMVIYPPFSSLLGANERGMSKKSQ